MGGQRLYVLLAIVALASGFQVLGAERAALGSRAGAGQEGGIFRISLNAVSGIDYMDPALSSSPPGWALLDTTCARLMAYPDKPPPAGFRLEPEVAAGFPAISRDGKTYTFRLRSGFRFSDGTPVRASAFARAINRMLAPEMNSPGVHYARDIVGAGRVLAGKTAAAAGVEARGNTLVVRLTRPAPDFPHRTASTFFCAVPPELPIDAEGVGAFPAAGPYYVVDYRRGERVVLRRNPFYGGRRPHHVAGFDVDLRAASPQEVLQRVDRGEADWGHTLAGIYFDPALGLVEKYGINRSQFSSGVGSRCECSRSTRRGHCSATTRVCAGRSTSPSTGGRSRAPAFARESRQRPVSPFDPAGIQGCGRLPTRAPGPAAGEDAGPRQPAWGKGRPVRQQLPPRWRSGSSVKQQLAEIGLDVEVRGIPIHSATAAYFNKLATPGEPWDIAFGLWSPSYIDPFAYINLLFDRRFVGGTNFARFASGAYDQADAASGAPTGAVIATVHTEHSTGASRETLHPRQRSASSTSRRSCRSASAASCCGPCST